MPKTVKIFQTTDFGRRLVALVQGVVKIESTPEIADDPYCSTFRTRFFNKSGGWTTTWSDSTSWEVDAV